MQEHDYAKQQVSLFISDKINMGGFGSGRGSRRNAWRSKKLKTESLPGLDVTELIKTFKATSKNIFHFEGIELTVGESIVGLKRLKGEPLQASSINAVSVPCRYGGCRYFVCCPYCGKQVRTLYLHSSIFACRHCFKMGYWSQCYTLSYRLLLKRRMARAKLNDDEWTKPKWMRQKTFKRLRSEFFELDEKEQMADFFRLRNLHQVDELCKKYGDVVIAAEALSN